MKYIIIILSTFLLFSCSNSHPAPTNYDLANNFIDSIDAQGKQLENILRNLNPQTDASTYYFTEMNIYLFAKLYQMELNKLEPGSKKDEIMTRYKQIVTRDPDYFLPEDQKRLVIIAVFGH